MAGRACMRAAHLSSEPDCGVPSSSDACTPLATLFAQYMPPNRLRNIRYDVDRELSQIANDGILDRISPPEHPPVTATGLECSICHEMYDNHARIAILQCKHHYHHTCIGRWIDQRPHTAPTCPICRASCVVNDVRLSSNLNGPDMAEFLTPTPSGSTASSQESVPPELFPIFPGKSLLRSNR